MPGSRSYTVIIGDTWRSHHSDSKPCKCIPLYAQLNAPSTHLIRMERDSRECTAWAPPGTLEGTKGSEGPWSLIFFLVNLRSLESVFSTLGKKVFFLLWVFAWEELLPAFPPPSLLAYLSFSNIYSMHPTFQTLCWERWDAHDDVYSTGIKWWVTKAVKDKIYWHQII